MNERLLHDVEYMIKFNPNTQKKLHLLGYDNPEYVEQKLKELERSEQEVRNNGRLL